MSFPAIELRGLVRSFGRVRAVDGLDLLVEDRSVFGFLGLNGAGKTTTLRLMLGLLRPRRGSVAVLGGAPGRDRALLRQIGVLFEDSRAHAYLTGRDHLCLRARLLGLGRRPAYRAADAWLDRVGLAEAARRRVRGYSQGMQRRLGLACALVHGPRLVLLDEPTNGLDPEGIRDFRDIIVEANRSEGTTFFLSSHILDEVEKVCDHVAIIHRGRLLCQGAVGDLTGAGDPRFRFVVSDGAGARRALDGIDGCRVDRGGDAGVPAAPGEPTELEVGIEPDRVPQAVAALVGAGVGVREVRRVEASLEEVFRQTVAAAESRSREEAREAAR